MASKWRALARGPGLVVASLVLAAAPVGLAHAQRGAAPAPPPPPATWESLAASAGTLTRADLEGLAWATSATCADGDDAEQRLCRAVRDHRLASLRAGTWLIDGDSGALAVGEWSPADRLITVSIAGCMACVEPPGGLYVVAGAAPTFAGAVAQGAPIHTSSLTLADAVTAKRFRARVPALRTQFIVRVTAAGGGLWTRDDKRGLAVDVLAARAYDPCDGSIVVATVPSGAAPSEPSTCPAQTETVVRRPDRNEPELPAALTSKDIRTALAPVLEAVKGCYDAYGIMGKARLTYTVGGDGSIIAYEQDGDFIDTPTGTCVDRAARAVTFPRTKKKTFTFSYPLSVP